MGWKGARENFYFPSFSAIHLKMSQYFSIWSGAPFWWHLCALIRNGFHKFFKIQIKGIIGINASHDTRNVTHFVFGLYMIRDEDSTWEKLGAPSYWKTWHDIRLHVRISGLFTGRKFSSFSVHGEFYCSFPCNSRGEFQGKKHNYSYPKPYVLFSIMVAHLMHIKCHKP